MLNPAYALVSALIWAFSPIYYRVFMNRFEMLLLNLLRTSVAAAVLFVPAVYFGFGPWAGYALASGVVSLSLGDALFFLSIKEMGASIAAPVAYTSVLFIQLSAPSIGEAVPYSNFIASVMVVGGVYLLSKGKGKPRAKGILLGLACAVSWAAGRDLIQLATNAGGGVLGVTFTRDFAAAIGLGVAALATGTWRKWPSKVTPRELGLIALVAVSDLVVGALFFIYSVTLVGVALTAIVVSVSPLLTQVFSRALGKEKPTNKDFAGGALIVAALALALVV